MRNINSFNFIYYSVIIIVLLSLFSCDKNSIENIYNESNLVELKINAFIPSMVEYDDYVTKAPIFDTTFPVGSEFGLCLLDNSNNEYYTGYYNIKVRVTGDRTLIYEINGNIVNKLYLNKDKGNAQIYAYYPYQSDMQDITKVNFDLRNDVIDYMYAEPVNCVLSDNSNLYNINLRFKHTMTLFTFRMKTTDKSLRLDKLELTNGNAKSDYYLCKSGTYNSINGQITKGKSDGSYIKNYDSEIITTSERDFHFIVCPQERTGVSILASIFDYYYYQFNFKGSKDVSKRIKIENYKTGSGIFFSFYYQLYAGKQYIHKVSLNSGSIDLSEINFIGNPIIKDWDNNALDIDIDL